MAEKKETKKVAPKKVAPKKKVEKVKEEEVVEEKTKVAPKATRQKRAQVDRNELIPCRSLVDGRLIYISNRTRAKFIWDGFGTTQYVEMGELLDMRGSSPKFLQEVSFVVEDEEAVDMLGLTKLYEDIDEIYSLEELLQHPHTDLKEILPNLPKSIKDSVGTTARKMIKDGSLDSISAIDAIEKSLNIDLKSVD